MSKRCLHWLCRLFIMGTIDAQAPVNDEKGAHLDTSKPYAAESVAQSFEVCLPIFDVS
jgi:hypothetical protein